MGHRPRPDRAPLLVARPASLADQLGNAPSFQDTFAALFPGIDLASVGGWLQLYAELLFIAAGFAAATFVSKWASDETDGRLEMVLATPLARARWVIAGGVAALVAIVGHDRPVRGRGRARRGVRRPGRRRRHARAAPRSGLYAAAIVGVGFAVGGLWRTSLAAEIAALVVVATYLLDLVAPPLKLPDWIHQLALTAHFGQPMVGRLGSGRDRRLRRDRGRRHPARRLGDAPRDVAR